MVSGLDVWRVGAQAGEASTTEPTCTSLTLSLESGMYLRLTRCVHMTGMLPRVCT